MKLGLLLCMSVVLGAGCGSSGKKQARAGASGEDAGTSRSIAPRPDWHPEVQRRSLLGIRCLVPCEPQPSFAAGRVGWDEHGAGGSFPIRVDRCAYPGFDHPVKECDGHCDAGGYLAELTIHYAESPSEYWNVELPLPPSCLSPAQLSHRISQ